MTTDTIVFDPRANTVRESLGWTALLAAPGIVHSLGNGLCIFFALLRGLVAGSWRSDLRGLVVLFVPTLVILFLLMGVVHGLLGGGWWFLAYVAIAVTALFTMAGWYTYWNATCAELQLWLTEPACDHRTYDRHRHGHQCPSCGGIVPDSNS